MLVNASLQILFLSGNRQRYVDEIVFGYRLLIAFKARDFLLLRPHDVPVEGQHLFVDLRRFLLSFDLFIFYLLVLRFFLNILLRILIYGFLNTIFLHIFSLIFKLDLWACDVLLGEYFTRWCSRRLNSWFLDFRSCPDLRLDRWQLILQDIDLVFFNLI